MSANRANINVSFRQLTIYNALIMTVEIDHSLMINQQHSKIRVIMPAF